MSFGQPASGCIDPPGDVDYYKITIPAGAENGTVTVLLSAPSAAGYALSLLGGGTVQSGSALNGNVISLVHGLGGTGGDYYLLVSATGRVLGPYSLSATLATPAPTRTPSVTPTP